MEAWLLQQPSSDLERLRLQAQPFGAELHDAVGAEGIADPQLTDGQQPQRRVGLQLHRRNQDGLMAGIHAARKHTKVLQRARKSNNMNAHR